MEQKVTSALCLAGLAFALGVWAYSEINQLKKEVFELKNRVGTKKSKK